MKDKKKKAAEESQEKEEERKYVIVIEDDDALDLGDNIDTDADTRKITPMRKPGFDSFNLLLKPARRSIQNHSSE